MKLVVVVDSIDDRSRLANEAVRDCVGSTSERWERWEMIRES